MTQSEVSVWGLTIVSFEIHHNWLTNFWITKFREFRIRPKYFFGEGGKEMVLS